jgi:hypothetical protein
MSTAFRPTTRLRSPSASQAPLHPVPVRSRPIRKSAAVNPALRSPTPIRQRSVSAPPPKGSQPYRGGQPSLATFSAAIPNAGVRTLPVSRSIPLWLRWLIRFQRGSTVVAFVLAAAALIVYSGTVYTQHLWSTGFRKLKTLQLSERQFVEAGGTMQNYVAKQAERPGSGLIPNTPNNAIFLQPAPLRPSQVYKPAPLKSEPQPNKPLGY